MSEMIYSNICARCGNARSVLYTVDPRTLPDTRFIQICVCPQEAPATPDEQIATSAIRVVLNRLLCFYEDHANTTRANARMMQDAAAMADKAQVATRWDARADAVRQVAEDLQISIGKEVPRD
jgi:hypothetical protein